jgi:hypothetical protein
MKMRHHQRDDYHAFDWPERPDLFISDLWRAFPEMILGRYLVNTSFDSGYLTLSESEIEDGWSMHGRCAHTPRISSLDQIPHDQFDEWLVFEEPVEVSAFETMVNFCAFTPIDFDWAEKLERFWTQVKEIRPLHIIGENDRVYFVSRDAELVRRIQEAEQVSGGNGG